MTKRLKRARRREKRTKRHFPSAAPMPAAIGRLPSTPDLPDAPVINPDLRWFVVQTFPQYEKRVDLRLHGRGHETYLPAESVGRVRKQRVYTTTRYLLPRHLFLGVPSGQDARDIVRDVQGVYDVLRFNGRDVQVSAASLQRFANFIADKAEALQGNGSDLIRNGDSVIVIDGPFASFTAIVTGPAPDGKVQADVMIFGRSQPVDFALAQLRAA